MKRLIAWWVQNSVAANLIMVAIINMGIVGFNKLEREFFPNVTVNGMTVAVSWLGASPADVQDQIITRVEDAVSGLDGIDYIEADAREGRGTVNIRTKVRADYNKLLSEVKVRIEGINNLPPDAFRPTVHRWDARADYMYLALHGPIDRLELQRLTNKIRLEIAKVPGGELVQDLSKMDEEVTIEVSEDALRKYGLTFSEVANKITSTSVNLSAGGIRTSAGQLQLKARNQADSESEFGAIIIRQTPDGGTVYLRDIATVIDRFEDFDFTASYDGETATMFQLLTPDVSNVSKTGSAMRKFIKDKNAELEKTHPGVKLTMWFDGSVMFDARMNLIGSNALMGMVLVLIILVLFLRPAVALWVTIGILVSFMGAIAVMPMLGVSLNMISTFAILLVIGIVVDDAIVVGESVHFHVEHGLHGEHAAIAGTNMVMKPVFFAVITTIMTFMPWMLLSGPLVAMTEQITLVVIAALTFSLIEAFFILPAHLRHLKPLPPKEQASPIIRIQRNLADGLTYFAQTYFRPFIAFLIKWRYATLATFIGLMIFSFGVLAGGFAKVEVIPSPEGDMIEVQIRFPEGNSFERANQVKDKLDAAMVTVNDNAKDDFGVDFPLITEPGSFASNRFIRAFIGLAPTEKRTNISSSAIADKLEEYLGPVPDAYRVRFNTQQGPSSGGGRAVSYSLTSDSDEALERAVNELEAHLQSYENVPRTWDSFESSAREMRFTMKPGAERLGITLIDVTRQVRQAFFGVEAQRLARNGEDVRVVVRYPKAARDSIDSLRDLRIRGAGGVEVPLFTVADVSYAPGVSRITRRDRKRNVSVGGRVVGGPKAVAEIRSDMKENFFPTFFAKHTNVEQLIIEDDDMEKTLNAELILYGLIVLALMYGLLAIAFKSFFQPLLIISAIPFAFVGMVAGAVITDVPLGMMSLFGFFAAAGVAVNDNLVLIDYINRLREKGVGAYQAVVDSCVARFRPILLTSVTTFVGILPMFAETSVQAQFLKPMVVALAFGILFDFFLTLMLVPAMYGIGVDIGRLWKRGWTGMPQPKLGSKYNPEITVALETMELEGAADSAGPNPIGDPAHA